MKLFSLLLSIAGIALGLYQGAIFFTLAFVVSLIVTLGKTEFIAPHGNKLLILQTIFFIIHWSIHFNLIMVIVMASFLAYELYPEWKRGR